MTLRERMLTALDHTIPDPFPIDLGGNQTGIHKNAYVFNNCHNIQGEVPAENIVAMYDTAYQCSFYD